MERLGNLLEGRKPEFNILSLKINVLANDTDAHRLEGTCLKGTMFYNGSTDYATSDS